MEVQTKEVIKSRAFTLPKKKVLIVPVKRKGKWLPTNHEASFLFKHSYMEFVTPLTSNGELKNPLTLEEKEYFEGKDSGMALNKDDLSIYKKENNFWHKFRVRLDKNILELDLSNPMDYIKYKVLLTNSEIIAPSAQEKYMKGTYKFAITEKEWENEERVSLANKKKIAYLEFSKMDSAPSKLKDFLNVYYRTKTGSKSVPPNASLEFMISETEKIIESDLNGFLNILKDVDYEKKILIYKAIYCKALIKRSDNSYSLADGKIIGKDITEAITYLYNPLNSETFLLIKTRVENTKY